MPGILITGGTGFVGRRLIQALSVQGRAQPVLLVRDPSRLRGNASRHVSIIPGDLSDRTTLQRAAAGCDTVVHLGARTGRASREAMMEANAAGTRRLLEAARSAGVARMLFVSSIAAGFGDRRWYHYAEAKREAEAAVRQSSLDWAIVRPTMVFGPGSPVQASLSRLALAPVGICFGKGDVMVQPIHVTDLVELLVAMLDRDAFGGMTVEAGGPEVVKLDELLRRIRLAGRGSRGPMLHLPIRPIRSILGLLDRPLWRLLPFTAGQLASFVNPGEAAAMPAGLPRPRHGIDAMLEDQGSA